MAKTAADLGDHVLPRTPLRQFVLTVPHPLRARLGYDGKLMGAVCRLFADSVLGWYRRRMAAAGAKDGQGGAVLALQRASGDLRLNPHVHGIFLDGVFVADAVGAPVFRPLPRLSTGEVADLLQIIRARVLRFLERQGVIDVSEEATVVPGELADREPALAQLAAAAVSGLARRPRTSSPDCDRSARPPRRRGPGPVVGGRARLLCSRGDPCRRR